VAWSNVSFSFRGNDTVREAILSFLYHAIQHGMTIRNRESWNAFYLRRIQRFVRTCWGCNFNRRDDATRLLDFAENVKGDVRVMKKAVQEWRSGIQERLTHSFVKESMNL
jgi:5-methyltetrahydrofolate--homocysteine methyltransferase